MEVKDKIGIEPTFHYMENQINRQERKQHGPGMAGPVRPSQQQGKQNEPQTDTAKRIPNGTTNRDCRTFRRTQPANIL